MFFLREFIEENQPIFLIRQEERINPVTSLIDRTVIQMFDGLGAKFIKA